MKTKKQIAKQLQQALIELDNAKHMPAGQCYYRTALAYVDALKWVLDLE